MSLQKGNRFVVAILSVVKSELMGLQTRAQCQWFRSLDADIYHRNPRKAGDTHHVGLFTTLCAPSQVDFARPPSAVHEGPWKDVPTRIRAASAYVNICSAERSDLRVIEAKGRLTNMKAGKKSYRQLSVFVALVFSMILISGMTTSLHAQALGWEGETGVFVTPLAYTASSENQKIHPVVAYHYFNAGSIIGDFHEMSITVGLGKRVELGYTHEFHSFGNDPNLSPLWQNGLEIFHGKVTLIPEEYKKHKFVPAVAVGFKARTNVRNVGNFVAAEGGGMDPMAGGKNNGDIYMVATKVVHTKIPVVMNFGVRGTNAMLWGMGGNAPDWQARAFGALAFVFTGPKKSTIIFGTEAAQQPHHPLNFQGLNIPTTLTYCMRVVPSSKHKLNLDFGVAQLAGRVAPGVDLKARHQIGVQMSYGF
jgi:hypothetical protein